MECKKEENLKFCNCSYVGCPKKGICCDCVRHHREKGQIPACFFPDNEECFYDRSVDNFVNIYLKNKNKNKS